jgi:hypothetical protein
LQHRKGEEMDFDIVNFTECELCRDKKGVSGEGKNKANRVMKLTRSSESFSDFHRVHPSPPKIASLATCQTHPSGDINMAHKTMKKSHFCPPIL